jgi:hypothetical protein
MQEALPTTPASTTTTLGVGVLDVSCKILGKIPKDDDDIHCTRYRGILLFRSLLHRIEQEVVREEGMVIRLLVLNPPPIEMSVALPLLVSTIRNKNLPVIICLTIRPTTTTGSCSASSSIVALRRTADFVFKVDAFDSFRTPPPSEFRNLNGILHVQKITKSLNHFTTSKPLATAPRYGISRDRRKLHLQMLHLPPEDISSSFSTSGSGSGSNQNRIIKDRKALCSTTGSLSLDF